MTKFMMRINCIAIATLLLVVLLTSKAIGQLESPGQDFYDFYVLFYDAMISKDFDSLVAHFADPFKFEILPDQSKSMSSFSHNELCNSISRVFPEDLLSQFHPAFVKVFCYDGNHCNFRITIEYDRGDDSLDKGFGIAFQFTKSNGNWFLAFLSSNN